MLLEEVLMPPQSVGPADLPIDKAKWRLPHLDLGPPAEWHTPPNQPVVDESAGSHRYGGGCQNFELQPGRRQTPEIHGVGKELKDFIERCLDELPGRKVGYEHSATDS